MQDALRRITAGRLNGWLTLSLILCALLVSTETRSFADNNPAESAAEGAQAASARRAEITLFFENDSTPLKLIDRTDRQYTSGLGLLVAHQPAWAESFSKTLPSFDGLDRPAATAAGYMLQQQIYTPDDLRLPTAANGDRRYAGYVAASVFVQRADVRTLDHLQIDLGVIGEASGAEITQQNWHDAVGIQEPQAWDTQLDDEPTFQMMARKKWRWALYERGDALRHELIPRVELVLGTVRRHVAADVLWRASFMALPNDFGPSQLNDPAAPLAGLPSLVEVSPLDLEKSWWAYGYVRAGGMLVEHDTFIEGSDFQTSTGLDVMPVVGRVEIGLEAVKRLGSGKLRFGFYQRFLTDEFEGQTRPHSYGGLVLSWSWAL